MKELRDCFKKWINEWSKSLKTVVKWINKALGIKKKKKIQTINLHLSYRKIFTLTSEFILNF